MRAGPDHRLHRLRVLRTDGCERLSYHTRHSERHDVHWRRLRGHSGHPGQMHGPAGVQPVFVDFHGPMPRDRQVLVRHVHVLFRWVTRIACTQPRRAFLHLCRSHDARSLLHSDTILAAAAPLYLREVHAAPSAHRATSAVPPAACRAATARSAVPSRAARSPALAATAPFPPPT